MGLLSRKPVPVQPLEAMSPDEFGEEVEEEVEEYQRPPARVPAQRPPQRNVQQPVRQEEKEESPNQITKEEVYALGLWHINKGLSLLRLLE